MHGISIREPISTDREAFLQAMQKSYGLHEDWVLPPRTEEEFDAYIETYRETNARSYLAFNKLQQIIGVFNISQIVLGVFKNAYLGFYGVAGHTGQGNMSAALKTVLQKLFEEIGLHRIEANIQPANKQSISFVKRNGFRYEGFSPRYLYINHQWRGHEHWAMTYEDYIRDREDIIAKDSIVLIPYQPNWPRMAADEIAALEAILPKNNIVDIQHVGSTAIPKMYAKPIIDIQIIVRSLDVMKLIAVPILQKLGYEYWDENPDPEKMFFVKGMPPYGEKRTHHIHIFTESAPYSRDKIRFRDYLRQHANAANEYQQLKEKLVKEHAEDREKYTREKEMFVKKILALAQ